MVILVLKIDSAEGTPKLENLRLEPESQNKSQNLSKVLLFKLAFARREIKEPC